MSRSRLILQPQNEEPTRRYVLGGLHCSGVVYAYLLSASRLGFIGRIVIINDNK